MGQQQTNNSMGPVERILSAKTGNLSNDIRRAATECHAAISKLALRGEVEPNIVARFAQEINDMLAAVSRIKNHLFAIETRIRDLSSESQVRRYFRTVRILEQTPHVISPSQRQSLERERDQIISRASSTLKQLCEDVRTLLILRLEMLGYWGWFLKKAIEVYTSLKNILRGSIRSICGKIQDPRLRELVATILSANEEFPTEVFESTKQRLPTTLSELEKQALRELEDLSAIESRLRQVKDSAAELETSEAVIREDIRPSGPYRDAEGMRVTERTLLRGLEDFEKPEESRRRSRILEVKHPKE